MTGTIGSQYTLFGFDIGVLDRQDPQTIVITTNEGSYTYPLLLLANGTQSLEFLGFETTTPGEYFRGFSITALNGSGSLPGITNVTVGNASPLIGTPEPASLTLLGGIGGLGALGYGLRRRKAVKSSAA